MAAKILKHEQAEKFHLLKSHCSIANAPPRLIVLSNVSTTSFARYTTETLLQLVTWSQTSRAGEVPDVHYTHSKRLEASSFNNIKWTGVLPPD